jgi:hypothetical protein
VVELTPWARLLFVGLWCEADRAGRLVDKPKQLKIHLFPVDNVDVEALLAEIEAQGLIIRYSVQGERFIQVRNFCKHQTPHVKEAESTRPAPDEHQTSTVQAGKGFSTGDASDVGTILTPDSGLLTPDSGLLTPDSIPSGGAPTSGAAPVENSPGGSPDEFADIDFGEPDESKPKKPERQPLAHTPSQQLVAFYVDERGKAGSKPTKTQIGVLASAVGEKLAGGSTPANVREAIRRMITKGRPPSTLPAFVDEVEAERVRSAPHNTFPPPEPPMTPEEKRANFVEGFQKSRDGQRLAAMISGVGRAMPE